MIDDKKLDEMVDSPRTYIVEDLTTPDFCELVRLARLGLWAEKYAVPAIQETHRSKHGDISPYTVCQTMYLPAISDLNVRALVALPEE